MVLLTLEKSSRKARAKLLAECVANGWSTNELKRRIQGKKKHLSSFGGRKSHARTTSNPALAARDIIVRAMGWAECFKSYFEIPDGPLAKSPDDPSDRLRAELEKALEVLPQVARQAKEAQKLLEPIVKGLRPAEMAEKKKKEPKRTGTIQPAETQKMSRRPRSAKSAKLTKRK